MLRQLHLVRSAAPLFGLVLTTRSFGIQAYWGGLAVKVVLSSIFPSFQHMANTLPESAAITTNELIGFVIYIIIFTPLMLVHPTKYHRLLYWAFGASVATMGGLFIWAVAANGGASVLGPKKSISDGCVVSGNGFPEKRILIFIQ